MPRGSILTSRFLSFSFPLPRPPLFISSRGPPVSLFCPETNKFHSSSDLASTSRVCRNACVNTNLFLDRFVRILVIIERISHFAKTNTVCTANVTRVWNLWEKTLESNRFSDRGFHRRYCRQCDQETLNNIGNIGIINSLIIVDYSDRLSLARFLSILYIHIYIETSQSVSLHLDIPYLPRRLLRDRAIDDRRNWRKSICVGRISSDYVDYRTSLVATSCHIDTYARSRVRWHYRVARPGRFSYTSPVTLYVYTRATYRVPSISLERTIYEMYERRVDQWRKQRSLTLNSFLSLR